MPFTLSSILDLELSSRSAEDRWNKKQMKTETSLGEVYSSSSWKEKKKAMKIKWKIKFLVISLGYSKPRLFIAFRDFDEEMIAL